MDSQLLYVFNIVRRESSWYFVSCFVTFTVWIKNEYMAFEPALPLLPVTDIANLSQHGGAARAAEILEEVESLLHAATDTPRLLGVLHGGPWAADKGCCLWVPDKSGTVPTVRSKAVPPPRCDPNPSFSCQAWVPHSSLDLFLVRSGIRPLPMILSPPQTVLQLSFFTVGVTNSNITETSVFTLSVHCGVPLHSSENELWILLWNRLRRWGWDSEKRAGEERS